MAFMESLGKHYKTDEIQTILEKAEIPLTDKITFQNLDKLADFLKIAIETGGDKVTKKELYEWAYMNPSSAMKVYLEFLSLLPGQGSEDKELLEGNQEAPKAGA